MLIQVQVVGSMQLLLEITQRDSGLSVSAIPRPASHVLGRWLSGTPGSSRGIPLRVEGTFTGVNLNEKAQLRRERP